MAVTDVKRRRAFDGTIYTVVVDSQVVKIKDDQARRTLQTAFSLPSGARNQVGFEVWPDGILEVIYIDSTGTPRSKYSFDSGRVWR